jgi:hypothetical protein
MTRNVYWLVNAADAELVATTRASSGTLEDQARAALALAVTRPEAALTVTDATKGADPATIVRAAADAAVVESDAVVDPGHAAAKALGVELGSVSCSPRLRALLEAAGGSVPGLLMQLVVDHDEDVDAETKRLQGLGAHVTVFRRAVPPPTL